MIRTNKIITWANQFIVTFCISSNGTHFYYFLGNVNYTTERFRDQLFSYVLIVHYKVFVSKIKCKDKNLFFCALKINEKHFHLDISFGNNQHLTLLSNYKCACWMRSKKEECFIQETFRLELKLWIQCYMSLCVSLNHVRATNQKLYLIS